jgi:hypothetical protein
MTQTIKGIINAVESSDEFKTWRLENSKSYLSSLFATVENNDTSPKEWLISYYNKDRNTFTTFNSNGKQKATKEEAFKKNKTLTKLEPDDVKVELPGALGEAEKLMKDEYNNQEVSRKIAILQILSSGEIEKNKQQPEDKMITVWNMTYITTAFNVINIKLDAVTGKVIKHNMSGVMDFIQKKF